MTSPPVVARPSALAKGDRKLPGLLSLSLMGVPPTALSLPLVVMIPEHYATVLGLPLAVIGLIFTSVRIFDIIIDPLLGAAMDRTRSRWGRYRPWLIFGAPALMLAVYLLFMAKPGVGPLYLLLTLTAAFLGWSILSLAQLAMASGLAAMLVFFVTAAKGLDRSAIGVVLIAQVITAMITVPAVAWLARRFDKHFVLGISGLLAAAVSIAFVFTPDHNLLAVSLGMMGWGLSFGAFNLLPRAMMADAADELRLDSGSDQTGVLYALLISSWKLGGALAVGLSFAALSLVGYKPALMAANTPEAISGLELVFAGPSAVLFLLGAWLAFTYPLTREKHAAVRAALDVRDAEAESAT
jgi:Na+/melibiose symporter-like transporter